MRFLAALMLPLALSAENPFANLGSDDLARGKRLFEAQCALCHGMTGEGGRGPKLTVAKLKRAANDDDLVGVVRGGVPGSEMPAAWWMSERESLQVAYFVRSLGRMNSTLKIAGDLIAGKETFLKSGCAGCHIVSGSGGSAGPELTDVGARRSPDYLREAILEPSKAVPEGYLVVRVKPRNGAEVRGIRMNEDSFTIQLRDESGKFQSFRKSELASFVKDTGKSTMPGYQGKLKDDEVDNLVAWLASLQGEP
jgi:putative heme-binding domain-containing protein